MDSVREAQRALAVNFKVPSKSATESIQGKTLLVTGGASGFGEAIAAAFTNQPDTAAIIADRDAARGAALEQTLREAGRSVKFVQVDVTDWDSITNLFRSALVWLRETYKQDRTLDHIVTCAGVTSEALDLAPVQPDEFVNQKIESKPPTSRSIDISITGSLYTVTAAMRYGMGLHKAEEDASTRSDKSVTMLSSMAGYSGMRLQSDYTASKWGVRGLFRSLLDDNEANSSPVRFNLVAPYFVATPLTESWIPYLQKIGIKLADIGDVEGAALRFIGDKSIHGRAAGVWKGGAVDLGDDFGGGFGSDAMAEGIESDTIRQPTVWITKGRE